jgi:hypothetical protein
LVRWDEVPEPGDELGQIENVFTKEEVAAGQAVAAGVEGGRLTVSGHVELRDGDATWIPTFPDNVDESEDDYEEEWDSDNDSDDF